MKTVGVSSGSTLVNGLPASLVKLINTQMTWKIAVSVDRQYVAIMRTNFVEIRTISDEYVTVIGRCPLPSDTRPQWRCIIWAESCDLLGVSSSDGQVLVFDLMGTQICNILPTRTGVPGPLVDYSKSVASLIFKETKDSNFLIQLLVITRRGILKAYHIGEDSFEFLHKFNFVGHYPNGIGSVVYQPLASLLYIGGSTKHAIPSNLTNKKTDQSVTDGLTSMNCGLTAWRVLSDSPHYKLSTDYSYDKTVATNSLFMTKLKSFTFHPFSWGSKGPKDGIYKLAICPNGNILAAVHYSGALSVWEIPSLRNKHVWTQEMQPHFDERNPTIEENPKRRKVLKEYLNAFNITDMNWWSNECLIICRGTGSLCLASCTSLNNMLGSSPEWFEPLPSITPAYNEAFLALECEMRNAQKRRLEDTDSGDDSDSEEESLLNKTTGYAKKILYYVTDSERFQPPKKKPKKMNKTYRMVCMKSTTPEELYTRKIDSEEYGEALMLAKNYNLDCDRVYQQQWRKTTVTVASIQDYLSKISKRSWVLHECLERVPENVDSMKELLLYGLKGTNLSSLIAIGKPENVERFVVPDPSHDYNESFDEDDEDERNRRNKQKEEELLKQIDFSKLTLAQKDLCHSRQKLLTYLDRLATYEEILGGAHAAEERYDCNFFSEFRQKNIVNAAIDYARECDWEAVDVIFTYHGEDTLPHRLAILSNFPETFFPFKYRALLPTVSSEGRIETWNEHHWRDKDWCEQRYCRKALEQPDTDAGEFLKDWDPFYTKFKGTDLDSSQLSDWYRERAFQIEELSCLVDNATELIRLSRERYVEGLDLFYDDLLTMETLIYDCYLQQDLTLKQLCGLSNLEKVELIMSTCSDDVYIKTFRKHLIPFLQRVDQNHTGQSEKLLHEYLLNSSKDGLCYCLMVFQESKSEIRQPIIMDEVTQISLALQCIYACERCDQLSNAFGILECLPEKGFGHIPEVLVKMHRQLDDLECHLAAAKILENHEIPKQITFFRDTQHDAKECENIFIKLSRVASRNMAVEEKAWKKIFADILTLRNKVYRCVTTSRCFEIFIESLLCSGRSSDIELAATMMQLSPEEQLTEDYTSMNSETKGIEEQMKYKVTHEVSTKLILAAAKEYINSSTLLNDEAMDLARQCLNVIDNVSPQIQEELDLIDGLGLLNSYNVKTLPLQVRMCTTRIDYVKRAMIANPKAYKKSQRLLKLGELLRVSSDAIQCEGLVLRLVAQDAIKENDYDYAYNICKRLMMLAYPECWEECLVLAESDKFTNVNVKIQLLSYAVIHCSPEKTSSVLKAKCLLQSQVLYERVHHKLKSSSNQESSVEQPFSASNAIRHTKDLLVSTTKTTQSVFSHVGNVKWWQHVLTSMGSEKQIKKKQKQGNCQGYYSFYDPDASNVFDNLDEEYKLTDAPTTQLIFRNSKIEEMITNGETTHPSVDVLIQLATNFMFEDTALSLGYLTSLPRNEVTAADRCFNDLPQSGLVFHVATYFYAIKIYQYLKPMIGSNLFSFPPTEVIENVDHYVTSKPKTTCELLQSLIERFSFWYEHYQDYIQAEMLQGLDKGVNTERFTKDHSYKVDTIVGLAMTTSPSVYRIAVQLAERYKLPLWDVHMAHIEALFDSELKTSEIEQRISDLDFLTDLYSKPEQFAEKMYKYVLPSISGIDHLRLIYYYNLLNNIPDYEPTQNKLTPCKHLTLLKGLKQAPKIDYKELLSDNRNPLDVIRPGLTKKNVSGIAKLASKIPNLSGGTLKPSVVYCAWSLQLFWNGKESKPSWVERYKSCVNFIKSVLPENFLQFVEGMVFVADSLKYINFDTRKKIMNLVLEYASEKMIDENSQEWTIVVDQIESLINHLEVIQRSPAIKELREHQDAKINQYAELLDLSASNKNKVDTLLVDMLIDGRDLQLVETVAKVLPNQNYDIHTVITKALTIITVKARTEGSSWLDTFKLLIIVVKKHQEDGASLVSVSDVLKLIHPTVIDKELPVTERVQVLSIIQENLSLNNEELKRILFYQTQTLMDDNWPDIKFDRKMIRDDSSRLKLLEKLLCSCTSLGQYERLVKLLQVWPTLEYNKTHLDTPKKHPWCCIINQMVISFGQQSTSIILDVMKFVKIKEEFSNECMEYLLNLLIEADLCVCGVKCVFILGNLHLIPKAVEKLKDMEQVADDEELFELLLQNHQLPTLVDTAYFEKLIALILSRQADNPVPYYLRVDTAVNQLQEAGLDVEGASLLLESRRTHPGLAVFDHTWNVLKSWIN